jgi:hypothetical protein
VRGVFINGVDAWGVGNIGAPDLKMIIGDDKT